MDFDVLGYSGRKFLPELFETKINKRWCCVPGNCHFCHIKDLCGNNHQVNESLYLPQFNAAM